MAVTRREFVDQHLPEATRHLEELLGLRIERLTYDGVGARAVVSGSEVDVTDALHGWLEVKLREIEEDEDTLITSDALSEPPPPRG
jgi:hypothetical protein